MLQSRRAYFILPFLLTNLRLWCRLEQYWQYSLLTSTQIIEIRNAVAAQSIQTIMESQGLKEQPFISSPKRQMEKRRKLHFFQVGSFEVFSMDLSEVERESPSATRAEQRSIMIRIMLRLSQTMRVQKTHFSSSILLFTQRFLSLGLFFMRQREAYISMRKKTKASSVSVQTQQRGSVSSKQMKRAMTSSMLSRMTRGPILSMLVNIVSSLIKCVKLIHQS